MLISAYILIVVERPVNILSSLVAVKVATLLGIVRGSYRDLGFCDTVLASAFHSYTMTGRKSRLGRQILPLRLWTGSETFPLPDLCKESRWGNRALCLECLPIVTIINSYMHNIYYFSLIYFVQHGYIQVFVQKQGSMHMNNLVECNYIFIVCLVINPRVYQTDTAATGTWPQEDLPLRLWSGSLVMVPGVDSACNGFMGLS